MIPRLRRREYRTIINYIVGVRLLKLSIQNIQKEKMVGEAAEKEGDFMSHMMFLPTPTEHMYHDFFLRLS